MGASTSGAIVPSKEPSKLASTTSARDAVGTRIEKESNILRREMKVKRFADGVEEENVRRSSRLATKNLPPQLQVPPEPQRNPMLQRRGRYRRPWTQDEITARVRSSLGTAHGSSHPSLSTTCALKADEVVFVEKPILTTVPVRDRDLWEHLHRVSKASRWTTDPEYYHGAFLSLPPKMQEKLGRMFSMRQGWEWDNTAKEVEAILKNFKSATISKETARNERENIRGLAAVWRFNGFQYGTGTGLAIYETVALCGHSCNPSCSLNVQPNGSLTLRTLRQLSPGDALSISYIGEDVLRLQTSARRAALQEGWGFICQCERCTRRP